MTNKQDLLPFAGTPAATTSDAEWRARIAIILDTITKRKRCKCGAEVWVWRTKESELVMWNGDGTSHWDTCPLSPRRKPEAES